MVDHPKRKSPATYADLQALPPHLVGEILAGELIAAPRPTPAHAQAASVLGMLVGPPFHFGKGGPGGWRILDEPGLHLGSDILVPDLAGWRMERMTRMPESPFFDLAPDWVCEVLSPKTERLDRGEKLAIYLRETVPNVWLLNPASQTLEVLRLTSSGYLLLAVHTAPGAVRAEPFDAIELDLGLLFSSPADNLSE
ncbi:MAG: Uma2 family endonuclease [Polyangia bacterium]|jgi:Uma2 family endonuclease|nr:Uma2 family endonuclease [Polyangia bacterium]